MNATQQQQQHVAAIAKKAQATVAPVMTDAILAHFTDCAGSGTTYRGANTSAGRERHISHRMSRLLRHRLGSHILIPDEKGYVEFLSFLQAMNDEGGERQAITEDEVVYVVTTTGASVFAILFY